MPKVFTTVKGLVLKIGDFGEASNTVPAVVSADAARSLEEEIRGERANPNFGKEGHEAEPKTFKIGRSPRTDIRIESDEAPAAPKAATAKVREA